MRLITTLLVIWIGLQGVWSQPLCTVVKYDETDGVSSSHITQLLQDERGFMWFATWNGLCRYDGYEFQTFKPTVGDGCHMTTDRIRNIDLLPDERILCRVEDDYYMFSLRDYRFRNLTSDEQQKVPERTKKYRQVKSSIIDHLERSGNNTEYYLSLVEDYMNMYVTKEMCTADIAERGLNIQVPNRLSAHAPTGYRAPGRSKMPVYRPTGTLLGGDER